MCLSRSRGPLGAARRVGGFCWGRKIEASVERRMKRVGENMKEQQTRTQFQLSWLVCAQFEPPVSGMEVRKQKLGAVC